MSSTLLVTTELVNDHWVITATIQPGGVLPPEIFIYYNAGAVLGEFFGTCSVDELNRLQIFSGTPIPTFGNKYVRYGQAKIIVDLETQATQVISGLVTNVKALSMAYQANTTITQTYTIP